MAAVHPGALATGALQKEEEEEEEGSKTLSQIQFPHFPSQVSGLNSLLVPAIILHNDSIFCVGVLM
jgi:hypothetical protein